MENTSAGAPGTASSREDLRRTLLRARVQQRSPLYSGGCHRRAGVGSPSGEPVIIQRRLFQSQPCACASVRRNAQSRGQAIALGFGPVVDGPRQPESCRGAADVFRYGFGPAPVHQQLVEGMPLMNSATDGISAPPFSWRRHFHNPGGEVGI